MRYKRLAILAIALGAAASGKYFYAARGQPSEYIETWESGKATTPPSESAEHQRRGLHNEFLPTFTKPQTVESAPNAKA